MASPVTSFAISTVPLEAALSKSSKASASWSVFPTQKRKWNKSVTCRPLRALPSSINSVLAWFNFASSSMLCWLNKSKTSPLSTVVEVLMSSSMASTKAVESSGSILNTAKSDNCLPLIFRLNSRIRRLKANRPSRNSRKQAATLTTADRTFFSRASASWGK